MRKRIISITLLFLMLFSTTVFAFTDVTEKDWFYKEVTHLKEQGIVQGYTDNTYKPYNNVNKSEALKMIMGIAKIEVQPLEVNAHWAYNYYLKAIELGILNTEDYFEFDIPITRQEVADLVVRTLQLDNLDLEVKLDNFKDTSDRNINILANIGIVNGVQKSDGFYFLPSNVITRAEISAILVRVQNYKFNIISESDNSSGDHEEIEELNLGVHKPLQLDIIDLVKEPLNTAELEKILLYMASNYQYEYTINYTSIGMTTLKDEYHFYDVISETFNRVFSYYPEFFSLTNVLSYKLSETSSYINVTLTLLNEKINKSKLKEMQELFIIKTTETVKKLIMENKITNEMTEKEKAKVLFDWVISNTSYDHTFKPESYTGYGQIVNGKAVCQGYTASYNYMCKLLGIKVYGIIGDAGDDHMWTVAILDGNKVHIDVTWGDSYKDGTTSNYNYFSASSEFMKKTHTWDSNKFDI